MGYRVVSSLGRLIAMMYPLRGYDACLSANDAPPRRNDVFVLAEQILRVCDALCSLRLFASQKSTSLKEGGRYATRGVSYAERF